MGPFKKTFLMLSLFVGIGFSGELLAQTSTSTCGDGICEEGEATVCPPCDDPTGELCPTSPCYFGTCDQDCLNSVCGNQICEWEEVKTCPGDCITIDFGACGNGVREGFEECDDGNTISGDGCSGGCTLETGGGDCIANATSFYCLNPCVCHPEKCIPQLHYCGDGFVDPPLEECEAAVPESIPPGFTCENCQLTPIPPSCGDGVVNSTGEQCDPPDLPPLPDPTATCNATDCTWDYCGNGALEGMEGCDDGNNAAGDGCSASCTLEECGNGILDPGEECDDGNTIENDGCTAGCLSACNYDPLLNCGSSPPFWTRTLPLGYEANGFDIVLDADENVYLVGQTPFPDPDIIVAEYDRCGGFHWSRTYGGGPGAPFPDGDGDDRGQGIDLDSEGNIYITGSVREFASDFDLQDVVTMKLDSCGEPLWTSYVSGPYWDEGQDVVVDNLGHVYTLADLSPFRYGGQQLFIEKYSAATGDVVDPWSFVMLFTFFGEMIGREMVIDDMGNLYVVSDYDVGTEFSLTGNAKGAVFKITPEGVLDETFGTGGIVERFDIGSDGWLPDYGSGIAVTPSGSLYITGESSIATGSYPYYTSTLFVLKFDSAGLITGEPFPLLEPQAQGWDVVVDEDENILVAGSRVVPLSPSGRDYNLFLRKYSAAGAVLWTDEQIDTPPYEEGRINAITVGRDGSVYVTGTNGSGIWTRKYTPCGVSDDGPPDEQFDPACLP